jgi:hypothetical protein
LTAAYGQAKSEMGRVILSDGLITDQEFSEIKGTYVECLESQGYTDIAVGDDGASTYRLPGSPPGNQEADPARDECDLLTDWSLVGSLHLFMSGNPEHIDGYEIMADCLVRVGVRQPGYDAQDYAEEFTAGVFARLDGGDANFAGYMACNADPAHASG